jgi:hypothetical protein
MNRTVRTVADSPQDSCAASRCDGGQLDTYSAFFSIYVRVRERYSQNSPTVRYRMTKGWNCPRDYPELSQLS